MGPNIFPISHLTHYACLDLAIQSIPETATKIPRKSPSTIKHGSTHNPILFVPTEEEEDGSGLPTTLPLVLFSVQKVSRSNHPN